MIPGGWRFPLAFLLVVFYLPCVIWVFTLESAPPESETWQAGIGTAVLSSLGLALGGAACATVLGLLGVTSLVASPAGLRPWLTPVLVLPLFLPPAVVTTVANVLFSEPGFFQSTFCRGASGVVLLSGVHLAPLVGWGAWNSLSARAPGEQGFLESAFAPGQGLRKIILPGLIRSSCGWGLVAVPLLLATREIASYCGVTGTLSDRVLGAFIATGGDGRGWTLCALWIGALTVVYGIASRRGPVPVRAGTHRVPVPVEAHGRLGAVPLLAVVGLAGLAMAGLVTEATRVEGTIFFHRIPGFLVEVARVLATSVFTVMMVWPLVTASRVPRFLPWLVVLPLFLPASVIAMAVQQVWQPWLPDSLYSLPILLSAAQAARFMGLAAAIAILVGRTLPRSEEAFARQLTPLARGRIWLYPRTRRAFGMAVVIVGVFILGEVEIATLLVPPGYDSPVKELEQFLHFRADADAAASALLLTLPPCLASAWLTRKAP